MFWRGRLISGATPGLRRLSPICIKATSPYDFSLLDRLLYDCTDNGKEVLYVRSQDS
jgi:hypothetical protein